VKRQQERITKEMRPRREAHLIEQGMASFLSFEGRGVHPKLATITEFDTTSVQCPDYHH
jgi:hypothetical protein